MISTEKLSALIGAIYDCAVVPDRWEATLKSIRTELSFATAVLAVNPLPAGDLTIFATSGIAPEWLGRMWGYSEAALALWGVTQWPARRSRRPWKWPHEMKWTWAAAVSVFRCAAPTGHLASRM